MFWFWLALRRTVELAVLLIYLSRGDDVRALEEFERELSDASAGHARECAANTWYAPGWRAGRQRGVAASNRAVAAGHGTPRGLGAHPRAPAQPRELDPWYVVSAFRRAATSRPLHQL
jgi:hypothetical protein